MAGFSARVPHDQLNFLQQAFGFEEFASIGLFFHPYDSLRNREANPHNSILIFCFFL